MDPTINEEWTSSEVEEAKSLMATLNSNKITNNSNDDGNNKRKDVVGALCALFPSKTMQQVSDLYVDIVVEMHVMQWKEERYAAGENTHNVCTSPYLVNDNFWELEESGTSGTHIVCPMGDLGNEYNFGVQEEAKTMDDVSVFGFPLEHTKIMDMEEVLPMIEKNKMEVSKKNIASNKPIVAPRPGRFWTKEEHRQFLRGLRVYERGDWKNISRFFVTTRTAIQVSSHAQKYFLRLEKRKLSGKAGRQRYSINDVELHEDDPWTLENNSGPLQDLSCTSLNNDPRFGSQAPARSDMMNNLDQFQSPIIYGQQVGQHPVWSEQHMMGSGAALMEGTWNFVPACQQGPTYLYPGQGMNMMY